MTTLKRGCCNKNLKHTAIALRQGWCRGGKEVRKCLANAGKSARTPSASLWKLLVKLMGNLQSI